MNMNGINAFSVSPSGATIAPQKEVDVVATFMPDHASINFMTHAVVHISDEVDDLVVRRANARTPG